MAPTNLTARDRRRLALAREAGFLDAGGRCSPNLADVYGLWCWRLKLPLIRMERDSPRSRYGRLHLDMFTGPNVLSVAGQRAMAAHSPAGSCLSVSAHDAHWERVPVRQLSALAKSVLRTALAPGNYRPRDGAGALSGLSASKIVAMLEEDQAMPAALARPA